MVQVSSFTPEVALFTCTARTGPVFPVWLFSNETFRQIGNKEFQPCVTLEHQAGAEAESIGIIVRQECNGTKVQCTAIGSMVNADGIGNSSNDMSDTSLPAFLYLSQGK